MLLSNQRTMTDLPMVNSEDVRVSENVFIDIGYHGLHLTNSHLISTRTCSGYLAWQTRRWKCFPMTWTGTSGRIPGYIPTCIKLRFLKLENYPANRGWLILCIETYWWAVVVIIFMIWTGGVRPIQPITSHLSASKPNKPTREECRSSVHLQRSRMFPEPLKVNRQWIQRHSRTGRYLESKAKQRQQGIWVFFSLLRNCFVSGHVS